jgi:ABC-type phosphate/phosphonate transport system permease subunit
MPQVIFTDGAARGLQRCRAVLDAMNPLTQLFKRFIIVLRSFLELIAEEVYVMGISVEQIAEEALALPSEARALLADRLVESLDPLEDGYVRQLWSVEAHKRREEIINGLVKPVPGPEVLAQVRKAVAR